MTRDPLCPYFGQCGGCSTQHLPYAVQLANKRQSISRATGLSDIPVFSGPEYFYRNRLDLVFHPRGVGLRKKENWRVIVPIQKCVISNESLNALLREVSDFFTEPLDAFDVVKRTGTFHHVILRTSGHSSEATAIIFVLNKDSTRVAEAVKAIESFAEKTTAKNVLVMHVAANSATDVSDDYFVVKGGGFLQGEYLGKKFVFAVQGFFQTNDGMAEKMQEYVHGLLKKYNTSGAHLLDLYGGVGTFGIINAPLFKSVTVVESVPQCVEAATRNALENGVTNLKAVALDAMRLKNLSFPKPLFVINDPPRSGMHPKTIEALKKLEPSVIIYISCNVQQLGKDLPKFKRYKVKSAALFDLFPQTNHLEAVTELVLKGGIS
ncbi:MAG: hypothetical protein V1760_03635 [Candidatus Peregrinibacteria bacterium]